jgi:hypothetical protein
MIPKKRSFDFGSDHAKIEQPDNLIREAPAKAGAFSLCLGYIQALDSNDIRVRLYAPHAPA